MLLSRTGISLSGLDFELARIETRQADQAAETKTLSF
jgi:hypothetical protein